MVSPARVRLGPERLATSSGIRSNPGAERPTLTLDEELELGRAMAQARQRSWEALLESPGAARALVDAARRASDADSDLGKLLAEDSAEGRQQLKRIAELATTSQATCEDGLPRELRVGTRHLRPSHDLYEHLVTAHRRFLRIERGRPDRAPASRRKVLERINEALARTDTECRAAQAILVRTHLRFVVAVARSYKNRGVDLGDLVQEGNLGLIRAAEKFDYRMGCRFNTYAMYWIRATIRACIANQSRTIRVPTRRLQTLARVRRAERKLENLHGRTPTESELATELGATVEDIREALDVPGDAIHLSAPLSEEEAESALERLPDPSGDSPLRAALGKHETETARSLLALLSPREARVLKLRFGIDERSDHTLEEIGKIFGVTRERIRQIEARALSKLRTASQHGDQERLAG